ncbi:TPA: type-F conjugative transfer system pilin assembly protein TrbC [Vibrio vulnificus]|uniref:type-F conjugative transfer system pilin assembly protein TrbC n=1 Tax=Vibrio vulnificus TaxID=672 RepID=UPI001A1C15DE|nr:type-F conjugative transfer system pilin assembly protein TrbC [Vibrio vulnificus]MCA4011186.1 type-F conjugative transfer system pilin assembly protein TrbC [Vibrio vulnificus]HAS6130809.1 type-F conjugative transfer system pilin assembly protein TrbC [Vibrio vulnificus]HAS6140669.1 type-F conjugative transfer system pilin assembly protein TrbC [Vibrio vulnificus]HAS6352032.1 type-F conjugative transfer system pilin assembly protein TrbC [Vibrio vulnificus]HAS6365933.1 type-F conjugative t
MKAPSFESALWRSLLFLCLVVSLPSQAYTEEELKAFAKLEQELSQQSSATHSFRLDQVQNQARAYQQEALDASRKIQALVKEESLSPLLGIQKPTRNPDQAPKGVMVFVSLTMPENALKQLLMQSEHLGVPLVIRGVLPDGFPATAKRIESLIRSPNKAPIQSGFSISPDWFKQFGITKVPAFVSVKPGRCLPEQPCTATDYDILYGNISLYQALDYLADGDAQQNVRPLLHTLYSQ